MKKVLLLLFFQIQSLFAFELGQFENHKVNIRYEEMRLAVIDNSTTSTEWLNENIKYLVDNSIPVLVLKASQDEVNRLNRQYRGLIAGVAPEPVDFLKKLMVDVGAKKYPVLIDKGMALQSGIE